MCVLGCGRTVQNSGVRTAAAERLGLKLVAQSGSADVAEERHGETHAQNLRTNMERVCGERSEFTGDGKQREIKARMRRYKDLISAYVPLLHSGHDDRHKILQKKKLRKREQNSSTG